MIEAFRYDENGPDKWNFSLPQVALIILTFTFSSYFQHTGSTDGFLIQADCINILWDCTDVLQGFLFQSSQLVNWTGLDIDNYH